MNRNELFLDIVTAIEISIFYISAVFINEIIGNKYSIWVSLIYMMFVTALYGIALVSKNKKIWLLKWGASIPFSYFVLQYFWNTHYSIRALNWVFPDYGRDTAGGRFAGSALFMIFSVMCLICGIITLFIKIKNYDKFRKIQFIVTSSFAVLIVCTVLILEKQFPSYGYIISHT